jgi:hypothetical protein
LRQQVLQAGNGIGQQQQRVILGFVSQLNHPISCTNELELPRFLKRRGVSAACPEKFSPKACIDSLISPHVESNLRLA